MSDFQSRLEQIAENSLYAIGVNASTIKYCFEIFERYIGGNSILELGPAEGVMTDFLVRLDKPLTCVDGSSTFCAALRARYPKLSIVNALFENYEPDRTFDNIVLSHVLEHVIDPVQILKRVKNWLSKDGIVLTAVPNAHSLHRQAAVLMGLLETEKSMSELDHHHGHYRVFDSFEFRNAFSQAGLSIIASGGYWLKPLSNRQIEETWSEEMLRAFMKLGERYPDIAGECYVIARLSQE